MIAYSPRSARAIGYLKRSYNDIEVYVEDRAIRNVYLFVIRKMLPSTMKLTSITQLGGRQEVLKACKLDQDKSDRRRLYIIDADFDYFHGQPKPRLRHLYRLRAYNIENILVSEAALSELGCEGCPNEDEVTVNQRLNYNSWLGSIATALFPLFVVYATVNRVAPRIETVGLSVLNLGNNGPAGVTLDTTKVKRRLRAVVRQAVAEVGLHAFREERKHVLETVMNARVRVEHLIAGKQYILPLIRIRLEKEFGVRGNIEQFSARLASHFDMRAEPFFARAVRAAVGVV